MDQKFPTLSSLIPMGCTLVVLVLGSLLVYLSHRQSLKRFPSINGRTWDWFQTKARREWDVDAEQLIKTGLEMGSAGFQLVTNMGNRVVLRDRYSEELRNDARFDVYEAVKDIILWDLPGFETLFRGSLHNHVIVPAIGALNRELSQMTRPWSEEAAHCLHSHWSDSPDWHHVSLHDTVLALMAQMTTRAFIGPGICRDPIWQDIASNFTMKRAAAVQSIQEWPRLLHPLVHWFLPICQDVRKQISCARGMLMPILDRTRRERMQEKQSSSRSTSTTPSPGLDARAFSALSFIDKYADGRRYDPIIAQLRLTGVSIHTTSDLVEKVIARLCRHPELINPLREEVISAVDESGLQHGSLIKMPLMESVMKETQRLEPPTLISMFRLAKEDITLSDGTLIPKNTNIAFANDLRLSPTVYPNPQEFDGYRFLKMRSDIQEAKLAPFTKTTYRHLSFGHGKHACPGRFMACNETKIIISHLLLKYDFKFAGAEGEWPEVRANGMFVNVDPKAMLLVRRRKEEVLI